MTSATLLGHAAAATRWADLPGPVRDQAADLILDTLAVIAGGATDPVHAAFAAAMSQARGACTVIGHGPMVGATTAALLNGAATTILQLQDGHRISRGHPASHIVPAALAMAEERGATADDFLSAFVAGYETAARVGIALGGLKPDIHDAGTWPTIGAAVAAGFMLRRDGSLLAHVIDNAATVAMLPWSQTAPQGAGAHHFLIGLGASAAVTTAYGAAVGLAPLAGTLEHYFAPRAGAAFAAEKLNDGIDGQGRWTSFEMMHAYLKVHPTCAHQHGINDAVTQLIAAHRIVAADVAAVDIATYAHGLAYDNHAPATDLAVRFSAAFTTAIALQRGGLGYDAITAAALADPAVRALAAKITVRHDPALDQHYPAGRPARVTITLNDGRVLAETCLYPRGDHTNPTTRTERRDKARALFALRFGVARGDRVIAAFDEMVSKAAADSGAAVAHLTAALRVDG